MGAPTFVSIVIELYVPPSEGADAIRRAARETYRPLLELLERHPRAAITIALDPFLAQELLRQGQSGVLQAVASVADRGVLELAGGSRHHALLPRLPRPEIARQLQLGQASLREMLGHCFRPQGVVPPALAYSRAVAEEAAALGMRWLLCDELSLGRPGEAPRDRVAALRGRPDIQLFFRDRALSSAIARGTLRTAREFARAVQQSARGGYVVVSIGDEHLRSGSRAFALLGELLATDEFELATPAGIAAVFPRRLAVEPLPCSRRTTPRELAMGAPFAAWSAPDNVLHALCWRLLFLGLSELLRLERTPAGAPARLRTLLDEGLNSAFFRFASGRPFWNPATVRAGAAILFDALDSIGASADPSVLAEARRVEADVQETLTRWDRDGIAARRRNELSEEELATILDGEPP